MVKSLITEDVVMKAFMSRARNGVLESNYLCRQILYDLNLKRVCPLPPLVLPVLKRMARNGLFEQSKFTNGYYGYTWVITKAGKEYADRLRDAALKGQQHDK
ncbi:hypothetical protein [Ochrobactrum sp. SFR4]|uniref:hypothetical protein n=1 Tax=Ochrobactrum sp. SFR4 TaxID=2717368 RepID=UPI001C8C9305|nr:hypothetical protein [Ochrobactrum sp. SFR4]MBX8825281.1 hypothetical protein [Ochrobactrum sp. SFR4]